jgi:hypothetical protein
VTTTTLSALPVLPTNPGGPDGAPAPLGNAMPGAGTPTAGATDPALASAGPFQAALAMALGSPTPGVPVPGVAPRKVPGNPGDLPGAATTPAGDGGPTGPKGPTITGPKGHKGRWGPQAAVAQPPSGGGNAAAPLTGILPVSPLTSPAATPAAVDPATALAAVSRKEATPAPSPQHATPGALPEGPTAQPPPPAGPPVPPVPPKGLAQTALPGAPPSATGGPGDLPAASATAAAAPIRSPGAPAPAKPVTQGDDPGMSPTGSVPLHAPGSTTSNAAPTAPTAPGPSALARRVMDAVAQVRDAPPPAHVVVDVPELDGLRMRVSLSGSTVHVAFIGESPDAAQGRVGSLIQDVASGLSGTGLQLGDVTTGGRPGSGNPERQQAVWGQPGGAPARARSRAAGLRI